MITADHAAVTQIIDTNFAAALWGTCFLPVPARRVQVIETKIMRDAAGNAVGHGAVIA